MEGKHHSLSSNNGSRHPRKASMILCHQTPIKCKFLMSTLKLVSAKAIHMKRHQVDRSENCPMELKTSTSLHPNSRISPPAPPSFSFALHTRTHRGGGGGQDMENTYETYISRKKPPHTTPPIRKLFYNTFPLPHTTHFIPLFLPSSSPYSSSFFSTTHTHTRHMTHKERGRPSHEKKEIDRVGDVGNGIRIEHKNNIYR